MPASRKDDIISTDHKRKYLLCILTNTPSTTTRLIRIDLLASIGWPYDRLEKEGIISPVVAVECRYKTPSTFADILDIKVRVAEFKGVKLKIEYKMTCNDKVVCEARSEHCFVNDKGMPIRLQKEFPDLYDCLIEHAQEDSGIIL